MTKCRWKRTPKQRRYRYGRNWVFSRHVFGVKRLIQKTSPLGGMFFVSTLNLSWFVSIRRFCEPLVNFFFREESFLGADELHDGHGVYGRRAERLGNAFSERAHRREGGGKRVPRARAVYGRRGVGVHGHVPHLRAVKGICAVRTIGDDGDMWPQRAKSRKKRARVFFFGAQNPLCLLKITEKKFGDRIDIFERFGAELYLESARLEREFYSLMAPYVVGDSVMKRERVFAERGKVNPLRSADVGHFVGIFMVLHEYRALLFVPKDEMIVALFSCMHFYKIGRDGFFFELLNFSRAAFVVAEVRHKRRAESQAVRRDGGVRAVAHRIYFGDGFVLHLVTEIHAYLTLAPTRVAEYAGVFFLEFYEGVGCDVADGDEVKIVHSEF